MGYMGFMFSVKITEIPQKQMTIRTCQEQTPVFSGRKFPPRSLYTLISQ